MIGRCVSISGSICNCWGNKCAAYDMMMDGVM